MKVLRSVPVFMALSLLLIACGAQPEGIQPQSSQSKPTGSMTAQSESRVIELSVKPENATFSVPHLGTTLAATVSEGTVLWSSSGGSLVPDGSFNKVKFTTDGPGYYDITAKSSVDPNISKTVTVRALEYTIFKDNEAFCTPKKKKKSPIGCNSNLTFGSGEGYFFIENELRASLKKTSDEPNVNMCAIVVLDRQETGVPGLQPQPTKIELQATNNMSEGNRGGCYIPEAKAYQMMPRPSALEGK